MLMDIVKKGSVDRSAVLRIIDSTDGTPETGVVFNTAGIDLWYRREGAAVTSITEVTLAALTTAHADGGFLAVSHGYYRLDLPDAALAAGANYVDIGGTVTGMVVIGGRIRLVDYDPESASFGLFTQQLTESYAADGAAPTVAQALMLIQQALTEFVISGTTTTIKRVDGSTTAATLTLNSATTPTGCTRAT